MNEKLYNRDDNIIPDSIYLEQQWHNITFLCLFNPTILQSWPLWSRDIDWEIRKSLSAVHEILCKPSNWTMEII